MTSLISDSLRRILGTSQPAPTPVRPTTSVPPASADAARGPYKAEVIAVEGKSYRLKEAQERAEQRAQRRRRKKP